MWLKKKTSSHTLQCLLFLEWSDFSNDDFDLSVDLAITTGGTIRLKH